MTQVFVSYDHDDRDRVAPLVEAFERQGWKVWWDREIPIGGTWDDVLERELDSAPCVVVVWSENSRRSSWVRSEAARAKARNTLVPVLLDPVVPPVEFERRQAANLTGWTPGASSDPFDALLQAIRQRISGEAPAQESAHRKPWLAALSCIGGLAGTAAVLWGAWRSTGWARPQLAFYLLLAALAAAALGHGTIRWLALAAQRTFSRRLAPGAALVAALFSASGAYVLATAPRALIVRFHGPAGPDDCPDGLGSATEALVTFEGAAVVPVAIRTDCLARVSVPRESLRRGEIRVDLKSQSAFVVDEPGRAYRVDAPPIRVAVHPASDVPRVEVALFSYRGSAEGRDRFEQLRGLLEETPRRVVERFGNDRRFEHLKRLEVRYVGKEVGGSTDDLLEQWRSRHALGLLWGTVLDPDSTGAFPVESDVFIGDLGGSVANGVIALETRIDPEEFRRVRDTHSAAILYALAMDARRLRLPPDVISALLSEALSIAKDLDLERSRELRERVEAAIAENGG